MSNKYINDAIKQASSINDPVAAHILLVLANRADPHGGCYPSQETIAEETGLSVATVRRKLNVLKTQGRLQWTTVRNSQGKNIGNRYRLTPATAQGELWSTAHPVPKTAPATAHPVPKPPLRLSGENPLRETHNRKRKPTINSAPSALDADAPPRMNGFAKEAKQGSGRPRKEASKEASEAFERFWAIYPRRVSKLAALKAWDKALKEASADQIITGARRYAAERQDENPKYTKNPATWLSGGCWLDEPGANCPHEKTYAELAEELRNGSGLEEVATNGYDSFADLDLTPDEWDDCGRI